MLGATGQPYAVEAGSEPPAQLGQTTVPSPRTIKLVLMAAFL